uniref:Plasmolipin n=1 Tax=Chelonoidis abingdonii TaxID=106734 RepID=A0A8C0IMM1_CHEAB
MAEFPAKVRTQTSTPAGAHGPARSALPSLALDLGFLRSFLGLLMMVELVMIFNAAATVLYVTAFITCSAAVQSLIRLPGDYDKRAAASFFACVVMIAYGASTFFSFQAWKGFGSNAATSQVTD